MQMQIKRDGADGGTGAAPRACPDHGHRLVPIHKVHGGGRAVIGWTCPEPYCDHVELDAKLTRDPWAGVAEYER